MTSGSSLGISFSTDFVWIHQDECRKFVSHLLDYNFVVTLGRLSFHYFLAWQCDTRLAILEINYQ